MSPLTGIIAAVVLLAINAFFVAGEFCITSSRKAQIDPLVDQGKRGAKAAQWALENVSLMLAVNQLGITLASTGLGAVAEPAVAHLVEKPLVKWGLPAATSHVIGFTVALILVVFLHILFGEMIPKNLTVSSPVTVALVLAPALVWIAKVIRPIVHAMDAIGNWFVRRLGFEPQAEVAATFTVEEVASIVELSEKEGILHDDAGILTESLEFSQETVGSVMVPLNDMVCLDKATTPAQIELAVAKTGYSRFPITGDNGAVLGYIHLKDILDVPDEGRDRPLKSEKIRSLPTSRPEAEVERALELMQHTGVHVAQVLDETNALVGFIFLEDIMEVLVGEVRDVMQRL